MLKDSKKKSIKARIAAHQGRLKHRRFKVFLKREIHRKNLWMEKMLISLDKVIEP